MHASRLPRSRSLVAGGVLLAAAMAASASCPAADRPPTIYLIGNSLTLDSSPEALAGPGLPAENVRWHLDGDASLPHIKAHPEKPSIESSSAWPEAIGKQQFDVVAVQVHSGSTLEEDADTISFFMERQPGATFVVHSGWASKEAREIEFENASPPKKMVHSTGYLRALVNEVRRRHPGRELRQTFAQNLLAAVAEDAAAGKAAIGVDALYRDDIHLRPDHGRYLMHNAMRRAVGLPASAAGFENLDPRIKEYLDGLLGWLGTTPADREALAAVLAVDSATDRAAAAARIADERLRERVVALLPAIAAAAADLPRWRKLDAAVAAVGGKVVYGSTAPQWLVLATGDAGLDVFDAPICVDLYNGGNHRKKGGTRNELVTDDWLENLEGVHSLRRLSLANTAVRGPGLRHVSGLVNLRHLSLSLTEVGDEAFPHLAGLVLLQELDLSSSQCTGSGFAHLGAVKGLRRVNFHHAQVNDTGLAAIAKVPISEHLWLAHGHFTDAGVAHLASQTTLRECGLGSKEPGSSGKAVAALVGLPLEKLWIYQGQASAEGVAIAASIPTLERLDGGQPDDATLERLAAAPRLEELIIAADDLTDAGLVKLATSKSLERLRLTNYRRTTKVTAAGVEELRRLAPKLSIEGP
jgi:hypothetical protein